MTKKNELCPFCGNDAIGVGYNDKEIGPSKWRAVCYDCGAHGPYCNTSTEAMDAWNHRFVTDTNDGSKVAKVLNQARISRYAFGECGNCGAPVIKPDKYCSECGAKLEWSYKE